MTSGRYLTAAVVCVAAIVLSSASMTAVAQAPPRPTALRVDVRSDRDSATVVGHASSVRDLVIDIAARAGFVLLDAERIPADPIDMDYVDVPLQVVVRNLLTDAGVNFLMAGQADRLVPARVLIVGRTAAAPAAGTAATPSASVVTGEPVVPPARGPSPVRSILGDPAAEDLAAGAAISDPLLPSETREPTRTEAGSWSGADTRPAPYEVRPVRPEEVAMPVSQGAMAPPITGLQGAASAVLRYALGAETPGQAVPVVAVTPEVTLPSGITFGAASGQSGATGATGAMLPVTGGTPDPAAAQLLMPGFTGPQLMTGPPPGTPVQTGTPTPPKTTASPIIK